MVSAVPLSCQALDANGSAAIHVCCLLCVCVCLRRSAFDSVCHAKLKWLPVAQSHPAGKAAWREGCEYDHSVFEVLCHL